jgi:hypothetical protein
MRGIGQDRPQPFPHRILVTSGVENLQVEIDQVHLFEYGQASMQGEAACGLDPGMNAAFGAQIDESVDEVGVERRLSAAQGDAASAAEIGLVA